MDKWLGLMVYGLGFVMVFVVVKWLSGYGL